MKITQTRDVTPGALLRELMEKRTGKIMREGYDALDRPMGQVPAIRDETYEAVAQDFMAALRSQDTRE